MKPLFNPKNQPMKIAGFMSGVGTNLRNLINFQKELEREGKKLFKVVAVFTEKPQCNAKTIAAEFSIPYIENDIYEFYSSRNAERKDMNIRKEFDLITADLLKPSKVDCVALCGYDSFVTGIICNRFITLNVHPADLSIKNKEGKRRYAGLVGANAVYQILKEGCNEIKSTIILVDEGADTGPILVLSKPLKINKKEIPEKEEDLIEFSSKIQELQKENCDWPAYRMAIKFLAEGRLGIDENKRIYLDDKHLENGYEMK